jgi:predicted amino acid-binding ACT domain protein
MSPPKDEEVCNLMNLDFDMGASFPADHRDYQLSPRQQLGVGDQLADPPSPIAELINQESSHMAATAETLDVKAELDSLLISLQIATAPCPPTGASIANSRHSSASTSPDLVDCPPQLTPTSIDFQALRQEHQSQLTAIDNRLLEAKQLKFRTQQLAKHSQSRFEQAEQMLASISQIHADIIANLTKFGGHAEIHDMLAQLETTRHSLIIAHDRATTGQEAFYDSLRAIQGDVNSRSEESVQKLAQYQTSIQSLSQTISTDRLQIASMSVDLSTKLTDLDNFNTQIAATHTEIVATAQTIKSRIVEIDRGFVELIASVQNEKEQFYELTVETIEKADAIKSQLANISNQISADQESIAALQQELASVRQVIRQETAQKLTNLDLRYHQLISLWDDFQVRQKDRGFNSHKFTRWLWILSIAMACIFVMLIRVLMILR